MLTVSLDETDGIVVLEPKDQLSESDFLKVAKTVDPYLELNESLRGLLIHADAFPGWDSFASMIAHVKFVKEHHKQVARVAFATNSPLGGVAEKVAAHFVSAEVKTFGFDESDQAREWILTD